MKLGTHWSEEAKARMSATRSGKPHPHAGTPSSDKARAKISVALTGNTNSFGHRLSEETRAKLSVLKVGNTNHLGHPHSEATKAKISLATKEAQNRPEVKAKHYTGGPAVSRRRAYAKRRVLGFIPLNTVFVGCEGHHVNNEQVINMPKALHRSIYHNQHTGQGMAKMNALAYNFLFKQEVEAAIAAREMARAIN